MRKTSILSAIIALGMATIASTAYGYSYTKFEETVTLPASSAVNIQVRLSEDMAHRAENLPKLLRDRGGARGKNDGFSGNGHYGQKDLDRLQNALTDKLTHALTKNGVQVSDAASYRLEVTIQDARPNRPTFRQLSKSPNLSFKSRALGGAKLDAQLVDASGNILGRAQYGWYENNLGDSFGFGTWDDAERAIRQFSQRLGKSIND